ncbi:hypothetical protein HK105_204926 [Polyrhizophydium stewartii]|uniref:P22-phox n=1 Tax=Polyrhizophydium stewartii TaxID=2732419 RepID=A0ABR4N7V5_9FUNG
MAKDRFAFKWQPWANLQAFYAGVFILMGAIISYWYPSMMFAGINTATALIILAFETPFPGFNRLGFVSTNLYLRALLYLAFIVPGLPQAPTHTGVLCLFCAAVTYLWAAIRGEPEPPKPKGDRPARA